MAGSYWAGVGNSSVYLNNSIVEEDDSSSDDEFNQLIIDTVDSSYEGSKSSTPTTPVKTTPTTLNNPQSTVVLGENDFKGLTFVGKMDVLQPPDIICLYSYHWGSTHIDIITRTNEDTVVPMTNVYGRIIPGLTRNAVSNRIPKIGAKTIALSEGHISVLKKLQLPITARSHYLTITDFISICVYYKRVPPANLSNFAHITSHSNPVDILKTFNSQIVPTQASPSLPPPPPLPPPSLPPSSSQTDFGPLSPGKLNASLAQTMGRSNSGVGNNKDTSTSDDEVKFLSFKSGFRLSVVFQDNNYYILNTELHNLLSQANQNVIGPLRSLLNIPLEYASRNAMNALKESNVISVKACRVIIYKSADVIKMYNHWNVTVPQYLIDLSNRKFPQGMIEDTLPPPLPSPSTTIGTSKGLPHLMSPSGAKVELGVTKTKKRKHSHSSPSPLSDQDLDYNSLVWSEGKSITLLTPPNGEPHVAIAELVDKIFSQRSQISLQRRTRLGVPTVPATSLQIHALRARGSIDPSSGYSKLIPLSGVIKLAKEAAVYVPPNVLTELYRYIPADKLKDSPVKANSVSPYKKPQDAPPPSLPSPLSSSLPSYLNQSPVSVRSDVMNHPQVIMSGNEFRTAEGVLFQVLWSKKKIVVFTSARNISYVGLYQIYDSLFKHLVTRMNFKMRMRKLGIKSIRAPSYIRQSLIRLGALPNSSPVCGLLRISEMERLVTSYDIKPPTVFYDLFLNESAEHENSIADEFKDFTTSTPLMTNEEKLVVSFPRSLLGQVPSKSPLSLPPSSHPPPPSSSISGPSSTRGSSSVLQNLAKKISQKNHRLAKSLTSVGGKGGTRNCYSCGRSYPMSKKRCEYCRIFLVGHPCPMCSVINYTLCAKCVQCGAVLNKGGNGGEMTGGKRQDIHNSAEASLNNSQEMVGGREEKREEPTGSESSDEIDAESPTSTTQFSAPPIRTAVLKSMFPEQSKNGARSGGVVTKTIFSGNISASRNCQECGAINSRKAKKCRECRAPLQGRPCPQCARPNHSHSTECFKCGANLPFSASKWVLGGRIYRSSHDSGRLGMTNKQFKKAGEDRAVVTCIRCHRVRQYGRFKCGRCGDLYSATPVYELATPNRGAPPTSAPPTSNSKTQSSNSEDLLQLAQNLVLLGVGEELLPTLSDKEEELRKDLYPVEEELEAAEQEYNKFIVEKSSKESLEVSLQVELDVLILEVEKLNRQLEALKKEEIEASQIMEVCPDQVKELEVKLRAYLDLHDD